MEICLIRNRTPRSRIAAMASEQLGDMLKAVVDVGRGIIAAGGELHADAEALLLADGSRQEDLWGINFHPGRQGAAWVEFDSMINIRPSQGNPSRGVEDALMRQRILELVAQLVDEGGS